MPQRTKMEQSRLTERQLLERLKQGDPRAVHEWFDRYSPDIRRHISYKVGNSADVEELVQETFIQCLKNLALFQGNAAMSTWMKSVVNHEVADYYRKKYAKRALKTLPLSHLLARSELHNAHDVSERVKLALHAIRADYCELLLLKYVDGKTVKHIAHELNKTVKSVEADLFRARQDFKIAYVGTKTN
jgi:RNA polymerase sigma-70 factor, ECF subfamily